MSKLIRWSVPFAEAFFPSVVSVFSQSSNRSDLLKVVVAPEGVDKYPKYLVNFEKVLAFNCFDEACAPEREWPEIETTDPRPCAWRWVDSPWVLSYQGCGEFDSNNSPQPLFHYLIFGGDYNVEVISKTEPMVEEVNEPKNLAISLQI
jgi:hypothetical protein